MPYWTYILQSDSSARFYCGSTDNWERRVLEHNDPEYHGSKTTKYFEGPWKLVWREEHATRALAMRRERQIKRRGIGRFLSDAQVAESRLQRD
jgi:putative endonuclease